MLLLDTHILIWLDQGSDLLGSRARRTIEEAFRQEEIAIATISFWEVGMLLEQQRLSFEGDLPEWRVSLLNSGFQEIAPDGATSLAAAGLRDFPGDPADRMIAATTMRNDARLITADERLLARRGLRTLSGLN